MAPSDAVSAFELLTQPITRDPVFFFGAVAFYFFCQFGSKFAMNALSAKFRRLSEDDKNTWTVRFVACVNSVLSARTAYLWITQARFLASADLYATVPSQVTSTTLIAAYFFWDLIICVAYRWGAMYTGHAVASLAVSIVCAWPFGERYHGYFSGVFEMSNIFIHSAEMLSSIDSAPAVVAALKGVFSVLFLAVRPIGGTYVAVQFSVALVDS